MPPAPSQVDAVHTLISAFGDSFAPGLEVPAYALSVDGPRLCLTTEGVTLEEHASEWKRLCGRLWARALPAERARAVEVLLPTLCEFDGAVWEPMQRLLVAEPVTAALQDLAGSLADPREALLCRSSARFAESVHAEHPFARGTIAGALHEAYEERGALDAMALVKLPLAYLDSAAPRERLEALYWLRDAMRMIPKNLLAIHRLLVRHVLPIARNEMGLWREGAASVLEQWVPRLVGRGAYPEALPLLDALLEYGVAIPRLLPLRYECLLAANEPAEAERALQRLHAIADASGHLRSPWLRADQHVDDVCAIASWKVAKVLRQMAGGAHPFAERRLKGELGAPALTAQEAAQLARGLASRALELFERRAAAPVTTAYAPDYAVYIQWTRPLVE